MKYKVGDKVRVRKDLELGKMYGSNHFCNTFTSSMIPLLGRVVTIQSCLNDAYGIENYIFFLVDDMIEGLAEEAQPEEPEKAINLLREMKHNCEHANKYDDPKRHDKAKALGFAIELIEHGCSAVEANYKPEKPGENVKLYTWQDLCDYEILLYEKWRIANEQRTEQGQERSVMHSLRQEYMEAIKRAMAKLGREVPADKAKELGFEV